MKIKHNIFIGLFAVGLFYLNKIVVSQFITYTVVTFMGSLTSEQLVMMFINDKLNYDYLIQYYSLIYEVMFYVYLIEVVVICILGHKQIIIKFKSTIRNYRRFICSVCKYICIMVGCILTAYIIMIIVGANVFEVGINQTIINTVLINNPNMYIIVVIALLAPIIEEFIFRFGLIGNLLKSQNNIRKMVIGTLIFTIIHIEVSQFVQSISGGLQLLLMYVPMSFIYNYIYIKEKNIYMSLTIHIINNIGSIVFVYFVHYLT